MSVLAEEVSELMRAHELPLVRYVAAILRDAESARDVVQDTFIKYLDQCQPGAPPIHNPKAWLYRVAHNLALDHLRRQARVTALDETTEQTLADTHQRQPDEALSQHDAGIAAWHSLAILSERDRRIVILKVVDSKTYQEIAEIMDITTSNVGFILHQSLKKLAQELRKSLT